MFLVHYVIDKATSTTILTQVLEVYRGATTKLVLQDMNGNIYTDVTMDQVFPAYQMKDIT